MKHDRHLLATFREALLADLQPDMHPGMPLWFGLDAWSLNNGEGWEQMPLPSQRQN